MDAIKIMSETKSFAVLGASAREDSYGFKLVKNLTDVGYIVYPLNPKYKEIYGIRTYSSISDLAIEPDNIVFAMSPTNNIKALEHIGENCKSYIWFPPECWNEELLEKAKEKNLNIVYDVCPIGTYLKLAIKK